MTSPGSKIVNIKTNTTHIVDEIEVINGQKLIFTKDVKCFPYEYCVPFENSKLDSIHLTHSESIVFAKHVLTELFNGEREITLGEWTPPPFTPQKLAKKNMFETIWSKITCGFTSSND